MLLLQGKQIDFYFSERSRPRHTADNSVFAVRFAHPNARLRFALRIPANC